MPNLTVTSNTTIELKEEVKSSIPTGIAAFLSTLNILLSITISLGNALILVALHKETSLHPPTKLLFRCLAVTDLCVGVISQPLYPVFLLSSVTTRMINKQVIYYISNISTISTFVLSQISMYTSSAISLDRLLALLSGVTNIQVVTLPRVRVVISCFWLTGISVATIPIWNVNIAITVGFSLTMFCVTTSVFCYSTIYVKLRQYRLQVFPLTQGNPNGRGLSLKIVRYKNLVSSAVWVQVALVTCCIPSSVVVMFMIYGQIPESQIKITLAVTATLVYLNSCLNPILYCWKIRGVRQAAKETINKLNCCKSG